MTTKEIAEKLAEYINASQDKKAYEELYSQDIVSIENPISPGGEMEYREDKGMDAKMKKNEMWEGMCEEMHSVKAGTPVVSDSAFAFTIDMDVTMKGREREQMSELAVYGMKDGKIVKEEYWY